MSNEMINQPAAANGDSQALNSTRTYQAQSGKFIFRDILPEEAGQAVFIEHVCFPPHEACSEKHMTERALEASDTFLVAMDRESGKMAGFLSGLATDEEVFRDEFFTDIKLHNRNGKNVMLLSLAVLPEYRGKGLAKALMACYCDREAAKGRSRLCLTCLTPKVEMYKKMGYRYDGVSGSAWGGEGWHDMSYILK